MTEHYYQPKKYLCKLLSTYERMFPGEALRKQSSPILKGDNPELDHSEFISEEDKTKYMSIIDIKYNCAVLIIDVSTLSTYRVAPQKGHLECMKQLCRSIKHFPILLYELIQTFQTTLIWYMNPTNGYTLCMAILKKNCL